MSPLVRQYTKLDAVDRREICTKRINQLIEIYSKSHSSMERKTLEKNISDWKRVCK